MRRLLSIIALVGSAAGQPAQFSFIAPTGDLASAPLRVEADKSRAAIEQFLGRPFIHSVKVTIVGSRKEFDAAIPADWGVTPSQCWMVGAGAYDRLVMLSPSAWGKDACDHKAGDVAEAKMIMRHELTHVIHGQYNPTHDFTGMDEAAWFIEGLATNMSGQLDENRLTRAQGALEMGKGPKSLAEAWSSNEKYGFSGSMIAFLDDTYGRAKLVDLLDKTTNAELMRQLGTTEQEFLAGWQTWLKAQTPKARE